MDKMTPLGIGWLSGMIDGEACFMTSYKGTGCPSLSFVVASRYDDLIVEKTIKKMLGCGTLHLIDAKGASTQCHLVISGIKNAIKIIPILNCCKFLTKKKYEYRAWREIALLASGYLGSHKVPEEIRDRFIELVNEVKAHKHRAKREHLSGEEREKVIKFMDTPL